MKGITPGAGRSWLTVITAKNQVKIKNLEMRRKRKGAEVFGGIAVKSAVISRVDEKVWPTLQPQKNLCFLRFLCISRFMVLTLFWLRIRCAAFLALLLVFAAACVYKSLPIRED